MTEQISFPTSVRCPRTAGTGCPEPAAGLSIVAGDKPAGESGIRPAPVSGQ